MAKILKKLDWPILWGEGRPECVLITEGLSAYAVIPSRNNWRWNVMKFKHCESAKYGGPNDEVMPAHPLAKEGLEDGGGFYILEKSGWKTELENINKFHSQYDPGYWKEIRHYMLVLREHILECLAKSFEVKKTNLALSEIASILVDEERESMLFHRVP